MRAHLLLSALGRVEAARDALEHALRLTEDASVRRFLQQKFGVTCA